MQTKELDVVYFVKDGQNEELTFSLRSVEKNLAHRSVWIYGGKPKEIEPDHYVHIIQNPNKGTKWDRVRAMFRAVCLNQEISEDFILFNDDFYVLTPTDKISPTYRCGLAEHIITIECNYNDRPTDYSLELRKTFKKLNELGLSTLSYELHTPIILNRHKLLEVMGAFPDEHCTRTLYGNYLALGGHQQKDVKIYKNGQSIDKTARFLSSEDSTFKTSGVEEYLSELFPEKSKFEK